MIPWLVSRLIVRSLTASFRRICWVGSPPTWPAGVPLVVYANHHSFYDGYALWYAIHRHLGRPFLVWMEEWDRFPLFAATGAMPFPAGDPTRRASTIRRTSGALRRAPGTTLAYFPESRLHAPEEGILPFPHETLRRLDRLLGHPLWAPVALHVTWWGESLPTLLLHAGEAHSADGAEYSRLVDLWQGLRSAKPAATTTLLEGRRGPNESRGMAFTRFFFSRYLP